MFDARRKQSGIEDLWQGNASKSDFKNAGGVEMEARCKDEDGMYSVTRRR